MPALFSGFNILPFLTVSEPGKKHLRFFKHGLLFSRIEVIGLKKDFPERLIQYRIDTVFGRETPVSLS